MKYERDCPLAGEYDVVVVGGGTAGFAAGVSAAREGATTLIVENQAFLGGMSTGGMINQFNGFAEEKTEDVKNIMGEVLSSLVDLGASKGIGKLQMAGRKDIEINAASYDSEALKYVLDGLVTRSGAEVLLHTTVVGLHVEDGRIDHLYIHSSEGMRAVKARVVIDATFHGSIASEAGCDYEISDVLQPGTLIFKLANVDAERFSRLSIAERREIARAGVREGRFYIDNILCRPLPNGLWYSNSSRVTVNPIDAKDWTRAEMEGRAQVFRIVEFLRERVPGFEKAVLASTGSFMGLRDSRRIMGKYVLGYEDLMEGTRFPDAVAVGGHPVDIHEAGGVGYRLEMPRNRVWYVPYRCMVSDKVANLLFAGRCISTTVEGHSATRGMPTCIQLGEAAGLAAAVCARENLDVNTFDGSVVSRRLLS